MAIIDTSKGVRPCVEELAALENNRIAGRNKHSIVRSFTYEDKVLREWQSRGLTFSYIGSGLFKIEGTLNVDWNGWMSLLYSPDNCPIIGYDSLGMPTLAIDSPDNNLKIYRHYFFVDFSGFAENLLPDGGTPSFNTMAYYTYSLPCSDGTILRRGPVAFAGVAAPNITFGFIAYNIPYDKTPIFEEIQVNIDMRWLANMPKNTVLNQCHCFNMYNLSAYFPYTRLQEIQSLSFAKQRETILQETDILNYMQMDNLLNALYTMSNGALKTTGLNGTNPLDTILPPYTELYMYETSTTEGE